MLPFDFLAKSIDNFVHLQVALNLEKHTFVNTLVTDRHACTS
jgi:hypothetical protein